MQEKLILIMKKNNITIREIADLLCITEKQTSCKIKGKTEFKCSEMFKIANFFSLSIEDIFLPTMYENGT